MNPSSESTSNTRLRSWLWLTGRATLVSDAIDSHRDWCTNTIPSILPDHYKIHPQSIRLKYICQHEYASLPSYNNKSLYLSAQHQLAVYIDTRIICGDDARLEQNGGRFLDGKGKLNVHIISLISIISVLCVYWSLALLWHCTVFLPDISSTGKPFYITAEMSSFTLQFCIHFGSPNSQTIHICICAKRRIIEPIIIIIMVWCLLSLTFAYCLPCAEAGIWKRRKQHKLEKVHWATVGGCDMLTISHSTSTKKMYAIYDCTIRKLQEKIKSTK